MDPNSLERKGAKLLPANAYTKLKPGESYQPIVPAADRRPEVTPWSIGLGLIMVVVFTASAAYIALRAGSGIEAAIPIAILAIFFGRLRKGRPSLLENVMVQSVGQASGVVAAGATFVVPALYINELQASWWQIFLACGIGGFLGIVLIIPLRKYFVKEQHGEYPFPEATAINEVLITGESTAGGAGKVLLISFALGALYDFMVEALHLWNSGLSSTVLLGPVGRALESVGIEISIAGLAALFGLGFIIGLRYAAVIAAGSVLSMLVIVPLALVFAAEPESAFFSDPAMAFSSVTPGKLLLFDYAGKHVHLGTLGAGQVFAQFVKPIGIGAIALSGLIGILRMGRIVASSVSLGFKGLSRRNRGAPAAERTQLDIHPRNVLLIQLAATLGLGVLFFFVAYVTGDGTGGEPAYALSECTVFGLIGMGVGFLLTFLFTPVAAQAIAIVGTNPVSGMTLITVVIAIGCMILAGLKGSAGMLVALIIGTAVCTALSTSGALISDFKVGYWIGSTPRNQQIWKFTGVALAALVVAFVIPLMNESYHFLVTDPLTGAKVSNEAVLPAPQANMIAAVAQGFLRDPTNQPWLLYGLGGLVAIVLYMARLPMLAFALGMFLPLSLNLAVLLGALCGFIIARTGRTEVVRKARAEQGALIASGMMAGAAIFGIITAILRLPNLGAPIRFLSVGVRYDLVVEHGTEVLKPLPAWAQPAWFEGFTGQFIGLIMLIALGLACYGLSVQGARWMLKDAPPPPDDAPPKA